MQKQKSYKTYKITWTLHCHFFSNLCYIVPNYDLMTKYILRRRRCWRHNFSYSILLEMSDPWTMGSSLISQYSNYYSASFCFMCKFSDNWIFQMNSPWNSCVKCMPRKDISLIINSSHNENCSIISRPYTFSLNLKVGST